MTDIFDFNDAGKQKILDVIPDNTICILHMTIRPGGAGKDGWLTPTHTEKGDSENLNCEFTVVEGQYTKRKLWERLTVSGDNHAAAIERSSATLRAILESARGIRPNDKSSAAVESRRVRGYQDFDGLRFMARLGVRPPQNGRAAQNTIKEVITPDRREWKKPESGLPVGGPAGGDAGGGAAAPSQPAAPANAITRPAWAQPEKKAER